MKPKGGRTRPAVAVLLDYMSFVDGAYQSRLAETFHEAAERLDLDLFIVWGRGLDEPDSFSKTHNRIFDLISEHCVDGVVAISSVLAAHCGTDGMAEFVKRYVGLPVVSLGVALPGVPSVVVDNQGAIETMVDHLIVAHGKRQIAFLAGTPGSPESEERLAGYRAALVRHGLPDDPMLVGYGNFMHWPARLSLAKILDLAGPIDALVAASDTMALGALAVLRERGLMAPSQVAVTGFDDVWLGRLGEAALTTAAQPFERLAEEALTLVLAQLVGVRVAPVTRVPTNVIVRNSCGCRPGGRLGEQLEARSAPRTPLEHLNRNGPSLTARVSRLLHSARPNRGDHANLLMDGLRTELAGRSGAFLAALELVLDAHGGDHDRIQALQTVVDTLREDFSPVADRALEDVWYRAIGRIAHGATTAAVEHRIGLDNRYARLLYTADRISLALDLDTFAEAAVSSLQNVGIDRACLSRFSGETTAELEPLFSFVDGQRRAPESGNFPAEQLLAPDGLPRESRGSFAVFPLVFETQWLGVVVFDYAPGGTGYQMLRDQFASGLGHVTLHQQILNQTRLHERSVQERQATSQRLEALSVLAGGVAHDLNNTLGPLVALPELILSELGRAEATGSRDLLDSVRADIACMRSAGQRAAQTIKDLLTLGRQGRAAKAPLELNRSLEAELRDTLRQLAKAFPRVSVRLELCQQPLVIHASESHVARAVTNLMRNAAEAINGDGEIVIRTEHAELSTTLSGYETIPAGDYALVSVSDTGSGIPEAEFEHIFEPFFSRKQLREDSGSGLGLAIVHGVAKEHEGYVDLKSKSGSGTTFTLYFPRVLDQLRVASAPPPKAQSARRILVVDDDPLQVRTASRVLSHLGYEVEVQQSGVRALELLERALASERGRYDLLLLDVTLNEDRDGVELLRQIRRLDREQKAVLTSGHAPQGLGCDELASGVDWLAKPYTAETLAKAIHRALTPAEPPLAPPSPGESVAQQSTG